MTTSAITITDEYSTGPIKVEAYEDSVHLTVEDMQPTLSIGQARALAAALLFMAGEVAA